METFKSRVGKNFRRFIEGSPIPNKTIAEKVGVSEPTLYRWMDGKNTPDAENLEKLADLLGVSPAVFYEVDGPIAPPLQMSEIANRIAAIPDELYSLAPELGKGHELWDDIIATVAAAIEIKKAAASRKRHP